MEDSGHYYTPETESLVPDMRLGGLDAEQKRNTSVAAGNPAGRNCPLTNEDDQCHCFTLNMAVRIQVQQGIQMLKANLCVESLHHVYPYTFLSGLKLPTGLWIKCRPGYQQRLRIFCLDSSLPTDKGGH
jgi:hypothetical protein